VVPPSLANTHPFLLVQTRTLKVDRIFTVGCGPTWPPIRNSTLRTSSLGGARDGRRRGWSSIRILSFNTQQVQGGNSIAAMASCALAVSPAGAVVASQAARSHGAATRPVGSASFANSELFLRNAALSTRAAGASSLPVHSRRGSVLTVCKVRVILFIYQSCALIALRSHSYMHILSNFRTPSSPRVRN
jgi:hypothetical protein